MKTKSNAKFYTLAILLAVLLVTVLSSLVNLFAGLNKTAYADASVWQIENGVVVSYVGEEEEIIVPSEHNGVPVTKIGKNAFVDNLNVKKVTLPDTITLIDDRAFLNCRNLESINFPASLEIVSTWAFGYCYALDNITFPEGLKEIGSASFYGCQSLSSVIMPNSVNKLGTHAFRSCDKIEILVLSNSLTSIPLRAFSGCRGIKEVVFPEGLTEIGLESFYECSGLKFITLPTTLEKIGNHAFYNAKNLRNVELNEGLTSVGEHAFWGASKIITVSLPSTLESIGDYAFSGLINLIEIYNRSSLEIELGNDTLNGGIGQYAKSVFTTADYSSKLVYVGGFVFYIGDAVTKLIDYQGDAKDVMLPEEFDGTYYDIGDYAFYGFSGADTITIHKNVRNIGYYSFLNCSVNKEIRFNGTKGTWLDVNIDEGNTVLENIIFNEVWTPPISIDPPAQEIGFFDRVGNFIKSALRTLVNNIFLVNLGITILLGIFLIYLGDEEGKSTRKKAFVIITCIQWILISGLRSDSVGADTENYLSIFDSHARMSFSEIFNYFVTYIKDMLLGNANELDLEPLFVLFNKLVSVFTTSHVLYKFVIATIFMTALGRFIYKYSEDPCLSFVIYGGLFYNMFSLTGYRQVIAVAIAVLWGYKYIRERKFWKFLVLVLLATLIHKSSIVVLLFYIFANKRFSFIYLGISLVIIATFYAFSGTLFTIMKNVMGYDEYAGGYGFQQWTFLVLFLALTIVSVIQYKEVIKIDGNARQYYNGLLLSWIFVPLLIEDPSVLRLVYTFAFVLLPLVPLIMKSIIVDKREKVVIYSIIYVVFFAQLIMSGVSYSVFWW